MPETFNMETSDTKYFQVGSTNCTFWNLRLKKMIIIILLIFGLVIILMGLVGFILIQDGGTAQIKLNDSEHSVQIQDFFNRWKRTKIKNCQQIQSSLGDNVSGETTHMIYPTYPVHSGIQVKCDFTTDGGNWTIIQTRTSGPENEFSKYWYHYEIGFGDVEGNYWLGLRNIHALTHQKGQMLRVEISDWEGYRAYAEYKSFEVGGPLTGYRLSIGGYSGRVEEGSEDGLSAHSRTKFSTKDKGSGFYCNRQEQTIHGGWWYKSCDKAKSNLNGLYAGPHQPNYDNDTIYWNQWKPPHYTIKTVTMKIRAASQ